jgi:hypothetical protein
VVRNVWLPFISTFCQLEQRLFTVASNFKKSLVYSGMENGKNNFAGLFLCLFPAFYNLELFSIDLQFLKVYWKLCPSRQLCSISTELFWLCFYRMKSPCLVFSSFTSRPWLSTSLIQSYNWIVY